MGQTITFRPTKKLADWIEQAAAQMGVSQGQFIRSHLEEKSLLGRFAEHTKSVIDLS